MFIGPLAIELTSGPAPHRVLGSDFTPAAAQGFIDRVHPGLAEHRRGIRVPIPNRFSL
jgi:hypothetical protein